MRTLRVTALFAAAILSLTASSRAQEAPPEELYSPNHQYSVNILESALPGSDPYEGFFTIVVRRGKHDISQFPTEGYLIDAFWSSDGKYVAVDNRRGNSGDYLWVFRLSDGRAIRMPQDAHERYAIDLVQKVTSRFPQLTYGELRKLFTFAKGWTTSGELLVKTNFSFRNLPEGQMAILLQTFKIVDDRLILIEEKADKAPWPPKT
jgi:hypothetical protein